MKSSITKNKKLQKLAAVIFWLGIWLVAALLINKEFVLPTPLAVLKRLCALGVTFEFWNKLLFSLLRIVSGFLLGLVLGFFCAAMSSAFGWFEVLINPLIRLTRATPVASFVLLIMLWVGYDLVPVVIAALIVMPVVYLNVLEGFRAANRSYLEVTRVFGLSRYDRLRYLYIPSIESALKASAVTGMGLAWKSGIAAEVLCIPAAAIGREIYYSKLYLETPDLFAWTLAVIVLSTLLEKLVHFLMELFAEKMPLSLSRKIGGLSK